jgi:hypothetical protein
MADALRAQHAQEEADSAAAIALFDAEKLRMNDQFAAEQIADAAFI